MTGNFSMVKSCVVCEKRLTLHEMATTPLCSNLVCKTTYAVRSRYQREQHDKKLDHIVEVLANHLVPVTTPHFRIPFNDSPMKPTPKTEVQTFKQSLRESFRFANQTQQPSQQQSILGAPTIDDVTNRCGSKHEKLLNDACTTCRGNCCKRGKTHAFLDSQTINRVLSSNPEKPFHQVYRDYLRYLPRQSVGGSCVYLTDTGCALPRSHRSDICNNWECKSLKSIRNSLADNKHGSALLIAVNDCRDQPGVKSISYFEVDSELQYVEAPLLYSPRHKKSIDSEI